MPQRKQQLLRQFRRKKRYSLLAILASLLLASALLSWYLLPFALLLLWLIHEAWFADHIFYSPKQDYLYDFDQKNHNIFLQIEKGMLHLPADFAANISAECTIIVELSLRSSLLGYLFDPYVQVGDDCQVFERGCQGKRYVNLTGQLEQLQQGLPIKGRYCHIAAQCHLWVFDPIELADKRIMILAPHADDAELAAYGLYSQHSNVSIVTLTQGEIEAEWYQQQYDLPLEQAAQLKGRLRSWDSIAIPLWGGVSQQRCVQLGYYCMQLPAMLAEPQKNFASLQSGKNDIRSVRQYHAIRLPSDENGLPNGENLLADLRFCLQHFQPDVVVLPHPDIDPHPDHIACYQAFLQANEAAGSPVKELLLYANHLHGNDRWPMGNSFSGIALPPLVEVLCKDDVLSMCLDKATQIDKAEALKMQHDLLSPLKAKRKLRRKIQQVFTGRQWPKFGENEYLRKAVRKHEVFWHRSL